MTRTDAMLILEKYLSNQNLVKHCIAVEAGMKFFAKYLGEEESRWSLAGLLHDLDLELTKDNFPQHGFKSVEILKENGFEDSELLDAIIMHSGNVPQTTKMGQALYAVDPTTGFLTACALMHPSKKLTGLDKDFIEKRFAEKRFAKGADRDQIKSVEKRFGIDYLSFIFIVLDGMINSSSELGL